MNSIFLKINYLTTISPVFTNSQTHIHSSLALAQMLKEISTKLEAYEDIIVPLYALSLSEKDITDFAKSLFNCIKPYINMSNYGGNILQEPGCKLYNNMQLQLVHEVRGAIKQIYSIKQLKVTAYGLDTAIRSSMCDKINTALNQVLPIRDYHLIETFANFGTYSLNSVFDYKTVTMLCDDFDDYICAESNAHVLYSEQIYNKDILVHNKTMSDFFNKSMAEDIIVKPTIIFMNFMCDANTVDEIDELWKRIDSYIMVSFGRQFVFESPAVLVFYTPPKIGTHHFKTCKWLNAPTVIESIMLNKKCSDTGKRIPGSKLFIISRKEK